MVRIEVLISDESGLKWCEQPRDCEFGIFFLFYLFSFRFHFSLWFLIKMKCREGAMPIFCFVKLFFKNILIQFGYIPPPTLDFLSCILSRYIRVNLVSRESPSTG